MKHRAAVSRICELLAERTRPDELLSTLLAFGVNREEVTARLLLLEMALRDLLLLIHSESAALLFFTDQDAAAELSGRFTASRLIQISKAVRETLTLLASNGNVRLLLIGLHNKLSK